MLHARGRRRPPGPPAAAPAALALALLLVLAAAAAAAAQRVAGEAVLDPSEPAALAGALFQYRALLLESRAARAAAGDAPGAGLPPPPLRRAAPRDHVIPLPLGWGYINTTYAARGGGRGHHEPTGCGGPLDSDRACGSPFAFDAVRYVATMEELVVPKGYPLEAYELRTPDGYDLALYRIPHGRYRNSQPGPRPLVFLQHGVTLASNCYVVLNQNESLAFILADAGFDVWMGNTRGNTYSTTHATLDIYSLEFWQFSIDQLALIDVPLMVDFGDLCGRTKWSPGKGLVRHPTRESCNRAQYDGADEPPEYDLSKVTAPQAFFLAEFDVLTMSQDVTELRRRLPAASNVAQFFYKGRGHMDFVWDRNSPHAGDMADIFHRFAPGSY
ncbi:lysosomal acid lipase cholesteryl ester hydrolase-like [Raphidocelis subcapitata]|uniref:Lysosomal acid lipase cholesteryl ester hydrolase-like n=1 Tax=Raphidocelis subcapitata TaxID=307507 RepID=A0A2V0PFY4_9CHLO|nr:lysosomal acid lipase cholesteryl ester hydrolase-like [Raphidocelis subcapitata]|eukprot:GBF96820.1 lysosomal acid lipase cholesteryl ester hydrolase-like [Raphidocelis subcapitata]